MSYVDGIHMHICPDCNRGWDCSNECGVGEGTMTKMKCGLCMRHTVSQRINPQDDQADVDTVPVGQNTLALLHGHVCMIHAGQWKHDDIDCAFETMMDPKGMLNLECPECMGVWQACENCGRKAEHIGSIEPIGVFVYQCLHCSLIFTNE